MPRTFGSSAAGSRPQPARDAAHSTSAATLLKRILDIRSDVRAPVDDVRAVDDEDQVLLLRHLGDRAARLVDQRLERLVLLIADDLLIALEDLLLLLGVVLGAGHVANRVLTLRRGEFHEVVVGLLDLRYLIDLALIDKTDLRGRRRRRRRHDRARLVYEIDHVLGDVLSAEDDDALVDDDRKALTGRGLGNRRLGAGEERSEHFALTVEELLLVRAGKALLLGLRFAARGGRVLRVELALVLRHLRVRAFELRKRADCGLIDEADVGQVPGNRGRGRRAQECRDRGYDEWFRDMHGPFDDVRSFGLCRSWYAFRTHPWQSRSGSYAARAAERPRAARRRSRRGTTIEPDSR